MKKITIGLFLIGCMTLSFAQGEIPIPEEESPIPEVENSIPEIRIDLPEVEIRSINYKYINSVGTSEVAIPVRMLEKKVASYDILSSKHYMVEEPFHYVLFKIPEGKILAVYNNEGEIVRTSEKFKDIPLAFSISNAVVDKYPGWRITGDIYVVKYKSKNNTTSKVYTLFIEKDGKKKKLKTDEKGNILK